MLIKIGLPKTLLWVINLLLIFLLMFTLFRLTLYVAFKPQDESFSNILPSLFLGVRFDLRWISLLLLPIVIMSMFPECSPFYSARNKKIWTWYLAIVSFIVFFFFAADFGCFSYNKTRLNASALNFAEDPVTSIDMLWESYPLLLMLAALVIAVLLLRWMFRRMHFYIIAKTDGLGIQYHRKWFIISALLLGSFIYGSCSSKPLTWNSAFTLHDSFKSYLALNPLQNFFATLKFRKPQYNEGRARKYFPVLAQWMNLPDKNDFYYQRLQAAPNQAVITKPNVVLVLCESFSMYKSSMSGNPLNTTPYFKNLCNNGIFFERCFTPHFSTARGLFATVTGIPDVQLSKFSTRNEQALDQHTIINNFTDYEKFYFLGGDPKFNNFIGLLNNIDGLKTITGTQFPSQPLNVWGISDKDLFLNANAIFAKQKQPFFSIIQTADNHRPFSVPEGDTDFVKEIAPADTLKKYGFESVEEFNAFRYADYCFKNFIEKARKENYFKNTIFVFVGDHGVSGNAEAVYPSIWTGKRLTDEHVPLLFYAPALLQPQKRSEVVSQIDVLPTIAGLAGKTIINTTLGRNILGVDSNNNHYAFIIHHDEGEIGMVTDSFYFTENLNFKDEELTFFNRNHQQFSKEQVDSIKNKMSVVTIAFYETAKWMLLNNKKSYLSDFSSLK